MRIPPVRQLVLLLLRVRRRSMLRPSLIRRPIHSKPVLLLLVPPPTWHRPITNAVKVPFLIVRRQRTPMTMTIRIQSYVPVKMNWVISTSNKTVLGLSNGWRIILRMIMFTTTTTTMMIAIIIVSLHSNNSNNSNHQQQQEYDCHILNGGYFIIVLLPQHPYPFWPDLMSMRPPPRHFYYPVPFKKYPSEYDIVKRITTCIIHLAMYHFYDWVIDVDGLPTVKSFQPPPHLLMQLPHRV